MANLFKRSRTVETIIAPLSKMVSALQAHHDTMLQQSEKFLADARELEAKSVEAAQEAASAEVVREKIAALYA